jgi:DNA-binding response OmpR family regulator
MRAIPVLMVTSLAEMSDVMRGLSLGANGYLSKPVAVESLRAVLRQILGRLPGK